MKPGLSHPHPCCLRILQNYHLKHNQDGLAYINPYCLFCHHIGCKKLRGLKHQIGFFDWSIHLNITYQKDHPSKLTPDPPISSLMCNSWSINRKLELVQHKETLSKQKKIANENDDAGLNLEFDLQRSGLHILIQLLDGSQLTLSCNQEKCEKEDCMFFAFVWGR